MARRPKPSLDRAVGLVCLGQEAQVKFGEEYLHGRAFFSPQWEASHGRHEPTYANISEVWEDILGSRGVFETKRVTLDQVYLSEWVPRSPGQYYTHKATDARKEAQRYVLTGPRREAVLSVDSGTDVLYDPWGKYLMINGGVGCHRLTLKTVRRTQLKLLGATSTGTAHDGLVVGMPPELYRGVGELINRHGAAYCTISGCVQFLPKLRSGTGSLGFRSAVGIPRIFLLVDDVRILNEKPMRPGFMHVTAAVTFEGTVEGRHGKFFTYGYFDPADPDGIMRCAQWLQTQYVEHLYQGNVLTDFDEQVEWFESSDPIIPLHYATSPLTPAPALATRMAAAFGISRESVLGHDRVLEIHGDVSIVNVTGHGNTISTNSPTVITPPAEHEGKPQKAQTVAASKADILFVTVNKHETRALLAAVTAVTKKAVVPVPTMERVYQDLGTINGARLFHTICRMGSGGVGGSQDAITQSIRELKPAGVIAVGIAFGVNEKKQKIGDVLVSTHLLIYELQRVGTIKRGRKDVLSIIWRGAKPDASQRLVNLFTTVQHTGWAGGPVHTGPILTGDKLVDNVDFRDQLLQFEQEAIGGEMEGAGLYVSSYAAKTEWIVVKAICDWADGNKRRAKESRQKQAAKNAAELVVAALTYAPFITTGESTG